jgi:hypothetical protein
MSMSNLAYVRSAYKSFSRSARHLLLLIASHQSYDTGWAFLSYRCLSEESGLTPRRVMQLVSFLEENHALEVRRGHGRGHVNFYRVLSEEDGSPVPHRGGKKVKSGTAKGSEKVKFSPSPDAEKVKPETGKGLESKENPPAKEIHNKEREKKGAPQAPFSLSCNKPEMHNPFWCEAHGFCHGERLSDDCPGCIWEG